MNINISPLSDFEKMGKFTCDDRINYLNMLDSLKLKSNLLLSQKEQLKYYDVLKNQYLLGGCGIDLIKDKCFDLDSKIGILQSTIDLAIKQGSSQPLEISKKLLEQYKEEFNKNLCETKINEVKTGIISEVVDKYKTEDEKRISEQTKKMVRQRIIIGSIFVVLAFGILIFKKK